MSKEVFSKLNELEKVIDQIGNQELVQMVQNFEAHDNYHGEYDKLMEFLNSEHNTGSREFLRQT